MRVLIIGASGFLGAHVRRQAEARGVEVVTAGRSELPDSPRHRTLDLSADDPVRVGAILKAVAPQVVVNCAGATTGGSQVLKDANITGPCVLTRAMFLAGRPVRLVHLGSAAEYGLSEPWVPVSESAIPRPVGEYGATKLAGTRLVQQAGAAGLDAVVLRVFNPIGSGAPEESLPGRVMSEVRKALAHGTAVRLGPLEAVRDFIDARDVAEAVMAAATAPTLPHSVLNVGSGVGTPARTLVKQLVSISGYAGEVQEDLPGSTRSPGVLWQQADITAAIADLAWRPRRDLATSLTDWWEETR
jgi:nucleoside-diphosphate-sugar epimerase